jgi:hypothetical protein
MTACSNELGVSNDCSLIAHGLLIHTLVACSQVILNLSAYQITSPLQRSPSRHSQGNKTAGSTLLCTASSSTRISPTIVSTMVDHNIRGSTNLKDCWLLHDNPPWSGSSSTVHLLASFRLLSVTAVSRWDGKQHAADLDWVHDFDPCTGCVARLTAYSIYAPRQLFYGNINVLEEYTPSLNDLNRMPLLKDMLPEIKASKEKITSPSRGL